LGGEDARSPFILKVTMCESTRKQTSRDKVAKFYTLEAPATSREYR